jgi:hypothetical protein
MAEKEKFASIADSGKPNAGRIYDYFLGGNHNFEVDRQAAENLLKLTPFMPKAARCIRWFLGEAVRRLADEGYRQFLDFASGLPTVDHIHEVAPAGTKVIYSDIDPVTVAYGQEIIKDNPNVRYVVSPAEKPEELLNSPLVKQLFGKNRKVAIGFNGIAYFLPDDSLHHAMQVLFDWVDKGSRLFLCDGGYEADTIPPPLLEAMKIYEKLGQPAYLRNRKKLEELVRPWKVLDPGYRPIEEWVGVSANLIQEMRDAGSPFEIMGAILGK